MQKINPILIPKNARQLFIPGPVGTLDCLELVPENTISGIAIICHPDPTAGGTNTNKIVQTVAKVLSQKGYICYCPNLRGVGMSDGEHDFGVGEVEDAKAIYNYIRTLYPDLPLVLSGFSFGTGIASQLALQVEHQKLILIGPAVTRLNVVVPNVNKTIVIHGELDEIIALEAVFNWARGHNQPIIWFPNTGHFFHGKILALQNLLTTTVIL